MSCIEDGPLRIENNMCCVELITHRIESRVVKRCSITHRMLLIENYVFLYAAPCCALKATWFMLKNNALHRGRYVYNM